MKKVRFVEGNVASVHEVPRKATKLVQRFGYQSLEKHRSKSRGPVSQERLAALAVLSRRKN